MPRLNKKNTKIKTKSDNIKPGSDSEDELHYKPKISHHSNYEQFLHLFHGRTSSLSEDEAGNHSGNEGFIDDELVEEMTIVEEGQDFVQHLCTVH